LPVSGAMFFDKDVILLLLFACCSYDVIFVALDANAAKVAKRSFYKFDLTESGRKCRDMLFDD